MPAPESICQLVIRFRADLDSYERSPSNETLTGIEFVNPCFKQKVGIADASSTHG